jgi:hypothetical protein
MKRSGQVALLLMGTTAVGGTAYTLMPRESCTIERPAIATPGATPAVECAPRSHSSSSSGSSYRSSWSSSSQSLFDRDSSSSNKSTSTSSASDNGGHVTRGGFGSFAHAFTSHFSGGG